MPAGCEGRTFAGCALWYDCAAILFIKLWQSQKEVQANAGIRTTIVKKEERVLIRAVEAAPALAIRITIVVLPAKLMRTVSLLSERRRTGKTLSRAVRALKA